MGQYYVAVFLADKGTSKKGEFIRGWLDPHACRCGSKLTEHSSIFAEIVQSAIFYISPEGAFYKSRLVWAGDYADKEVDENSEEPESLNKRAYDQTSKLLPMKQTSDDIYHYFVNHSKKEYIDLRNFHRYDPHPIPLLTAEGNGRGGGDYHGQNENLVGIWARDTVSVETDAPTDYTERTDVYFREDD